MVGSIDTHDGEDGFSAIELPRTIKGRRVLKAFVSLQLCEQSIA
jgi:hypothetical protein